MRPALNAAIRPTSRLFQLAAIMLLVGCGSSGGDDGSDNDDDGIQPPGDDLCGLSASVSGAYTASRDFVACQGFWYDAYLSSLHVSFGLGESNWLMGFDIRPIAAEQTATAVPAIVDVSVIEGDSGRHWATEEGSCTVDVTRFESGEDPFFGPGYHVAGEGRCSAPARPTGIDQPMGDLIIDPFQFHFFATL